MGVHIRLYPRMQNNSAKRSWAVFLALVMLPWPSRAQPSNTADAGYDPVEEISQLIKRDPRKAYKRAENFFDKDSLGKADVPVELKRLLGRLVEEKKYRDLSPEASRRMLLDEIQKLIVNAQRQGPR